jgi:hypothetical protein
MATAINVLRHIGLSVTTGFIMFNPLSTLDSVDENICLLREVGTATYAQLIGRLQLYPGSPLIRYFEHRNISLKAQDYQLDYNIADTAVDNYRLSLTTLLQSSLRAEGLVQRAAFNVETTEPQSPYHLEVIEVQRRLSTEMCDAAVKLLQVYRQSHGAVDNDIVKEIGDELGGNVCTIGRRIDLALDEPA